MMMKCYTELMGLNTFEERFLYLQLHGVVCKETFGNERYINQLLYKHNPNWKETRNMICIRDNGCDLGIIDREIKGQPFYIHHINPITAEDILNNNPLVLDPENLITTIFNTHQAIHYGNIEMIEDYKPRQPFDTCPWRKEQLWKVY